MADISSYTARRCLHRRYVLLPLPLLVTVFLLLGVPPPVSAFSQGLQIQNNFGVYCDRPVNQRYPVHADVVMCRGMCLPRRDFRNLFNISVSAPTYYRDTLDVTIRGSPRFGFYASIRGFAVIAITDEGHIVGSFREQPDALIASCDPLLEGHTAFHAFANPSRRFLRLTWSPDSKNFGRIRFRAWVVVRHNEVYVLDSDYVMNEMTGSEQVALQENFFGYVLSILNISRDVVEVVRDDGRQPTTSPATVSERNTTTRASNQVPPRVTGTSPTPGEDAVTGAADSDDDEKDDDDGGGEDDRREDVTMTILVPTSGGTKMRLQIPTFRAFEDMFERRLMTVGFNISADDPFEKVTRTVPEFRDLFPKRPPPPSNDLAPFARTSGSPFFQSFGGGNSRRNIIQGGSSFGFAGQRPNQNQFVGGAQNQFGQQSFLGNTLGFPTSSSAFFRGNTNFQLPTSPFSQFFQNGGSRITAPSNPFFTANAPRPTTQLGFPNAGSLFQRIGQTSTAGQFGQTAAGSGFLGLGGNGGFGQQFPNAGNPFLRQQTTFEQQNPQGNVFTQQQFPGSLFGRQQQQQQLLSTGNPFLRQNAAFGQQQNLNGGFASGQPQFTNSQFGQQLANQLGLITGQQASGNPFSGSGSSFGFPSTFSSNPFVRSSPNSQNQFNPFIAGQGPSVNQFSSVGGVNPFGAGGTNVNRFSANQFRLGGSPNRAGSLSSFFSNPQLTSQLGQGQTNQISARPFGSSFAG